MCVCVCMCVHVCVCVRVCVCVCVCVRTYVHPADVIARVYLVEHMQVVQQLDSEQRKQRNWGPRRVPSGAEWAAEVQNPNFE